jgi:hypothetical protein
MSEHYITSVKAFGITIEGIFDLDELDSILKKLFIISKWKAEERL